MKIEKEIAQKSFINEFIKADINIAFTSAWIGKIKTDVLKPFQLSWQQFNILRILKGMHPQPASVKVLTARMIDRMSNASRLVKKLNQKGYVDRITSDTDRRQVDIRITPLGLNILDQASTLLENEVTEQLQTITQQEAIELNRILDKLRG